VTAATAYRAACTIVGLATALAVWVETRTARRHLQHP
jgi:hypothetical protein